MTYPNFSVGETLTSSAMNAVGLWRVTTCTVSSVGGTAATASNGVVTIGSGNTSVTVSNAFSADYENYKIIVTGGAASATNVMRMTLGSTSTGYYYAGKARTYGGADLNIDALNAAFWYSGEGAVNGLIANIEIQRPFSADETMFSTIFTPPRTDSYWISAGGYLANTTSYSAFTFTASNGTWTGGTIRVYGYRN
jgi:hypothetical protein